MYAIVMFLPIVIISGLGLSIAGILVIRDVNNFDHFLDGQLITPSITLIVTGLLTFIIAILGFYGALKESPRLLTAFAVLLGIIFIVEIAAGVAAMAFKNDLHDLLNIQLSKSMTRQNKDDMMAWDSIQRRMMCCGVDSPRNWYDINDDTTLFPVSCCKPRFISQRTQNCLYDGKLYMNRLYLNGCIDKIDGRVAPNASVLIGVVIGMAFILIICIALACWLASAIKKDRLLSTQTPSVVFQCNEEITNDLVQF